MASAKASALVQGGYLKHRGATEASFITRAVPIVHYNYYIIGVCAIPKENSNPSDDGWFLSDFFRLKLPHESPWSIANLDCDI
jgi:hypothetical protein